jgi:hypothetical protein
MLPALPLANAIAVARGGERVSERSRPRTHREGRRKGGLLPFRQVHSSGWTISPA